MIDTLTLSYSNIQIPESIYSGWEDGGHSTKGTFRIVWKGFTYKLPNHAAIEFTYYPYLNGGLLKIKFSLPNVIYGNNVQMVYNIEEAIDIANFKLPGIPGIPKIDLWDGFLDRLDICYNFQVGNLVPWYVKSLQALEYPYRRTRPYTSQGVQYENTQAILRFYNKSRERKDKKDIQGAVAAQGVLRLEVELNKRYIKKLTGHKKPTLRSITIPWLLDVIYEELDNVNLLNCSIGTVDTTFRELSKKYGKWEALALIGLLQTKMEYPSRELLAQDTGLHPNSIGRNIQKKLVENGIPPTLTTHSEPLPLLVVDRDYVVEQSKLPI